MTKGLHENKDNSDYQYRDVALSEIGRALDNIRGKRVVHDKAVEALDTLQRASQEVDLLKQKREAYAQEMEELKFEQTDLDNETTRWYSSLDESDQTVEYNRTGVIICAGIGFFVGFGIGGSMDWFGIFSFLLGIVTAFVGAIIGGAYDNSSYQQAQEAQLQRVRARKAENRAQLFDNDQGVLTGEAFDREAQIVKGRIEQISQNIHSAVDNYMHERLKIIQEIIGLTYLKAEIMADEFDPDTRGKPVIRWDAPNHTIPGVEADTKEYFKEGAGRLTELIVRNEISVTVSIFFNEGRRLTENFKENASLIYSDTFGGGGEFVHTDAPLGKTFHYYLVTEIAYLGYSRQGPDLTYKYMRQEVVNCAEMIRIKAFKSEAEVLDQEIEEHTVRTKREKFHEKIGKKSDEEAIDIAAAGAERTRQILERKKAQKEADEAVEKMRADLNEAGLSSEEIEEAIEEFLQSI